MSQRNPTRGAKQDGLEAVQRFLSEREGMPTHLRNQQRLQELRKFVELLQSTDGGKRDLEQRRRRYGECIQAPQESDWDYYCRLRMWLDSGS